MNPAPPVTRVFMGVNLRQQNCEQTELWPGFPRMSFGAPATLASQCDSSSPRKQLSPEDRGDPLARRCDRNQVVHRARVPLGRFGRRNRRDRYRWALRRAGVPAGEGIQTQWKLDLIPGLIDAPLETGPIDGKKNVIKAVQKGSQEGRQPGDRHRLRPRGRADRPRGAEVCPSR